MTTPDPKPTGRIVADEKEWATIRNLLLPRGQKCACGCGRFAETLHHLVGRGQGGDDVIANLIPLSGDGTRLCHGALTSANRTHDVNGSPIEPSDVRSGIRENLLPMHYHYVFKKLKNGEEWLDRNYPKRDYSRR